MVSRSSKTENQVYRQSRLEVWLALGKTALCGVNQRRYLSKLIIWAKSEDSRKEHPPHLAPTQGRGRNVSSRSKGPEADKTHNASGKDPREMSLCWFLSWDCT